MNANQEAIKKLQTDIRITTENIENLAPDDDGLILKMGKDILLLMYENLVELMRRTIARLENEINDMRFENLK